MYDQILQEYWTYEWRKSKAKLMEMEAVDTFEELPNPEWIKNGDYMYVINEKQLYRCVHKQKFKSIH